jgi:cytochrome P450
MDPPEFRKYRNLLNPYFAPKATQRWLDVIAKWTTICLDAVIESGRFDVVLDLGNPVPALFTSEFLGLPIEDWHKYAEPMHTQIYTVPGTPEYERTVEGVRWIIERLYALTNEKRSNPTDDLLSDLTQMRVDEELLNDDIIVNMAFLIIAGGFDTTTAMLANMLRYLDQDRAARQALIDDPDKIKFAVEEFLRYFAPTQALGRTVTTDTSFYGQELKKGDRVLISWAAANHDPAIFDRPDEIVLDRSPNRHTTFGIGVHRCLGSNFARAELALMLGQVLERIPDYRIIESEAVKYPTIGVVNGWVSMPATFTPSHRVTTDVLPSTGAN